MTFDLCFGMCFGLQAFGGAIVVHTNATIDLFGSVFETNLDNTPDDGIGVVNLGGRVHCHTNGIECLSICTTCQYDDNVLLTLPPTSQPSQLLTLPPTSQPSQLLTLPPTSQPTIVWAASAKPKLDWTPNWIGVAVVIGVALLVGCRFLVANVCYSCGTRRRSASYSELLNPAEQTDGIGLELPPEGARFASGTDSGDSGPESVPSSVMASYENSPAPVFAISRNSMRIIVWSRGMEILTRMLETPVGCLLSDLPFVNCSDGPRLQRKLGEFCDARAGPGADRTFMIHLRTHNENVLLEMVANVFTTENEPFILMQGREVNSQLASLMVAASIQETMSDVKEDDTLVGHPEYKEVSHTEEREHFDGDGEMQKECWRFAFDALPTASESEPGFEEFVALPTSSESDLGKDFVALPTSSEPEPGFEELDDGFLDDSDSRDDRSSRVSSLTMPSNIDDSASRDAHSLISSLTMSSSVMLTADGELF